MARSTWLDDERTVRRYEFGNGTSWIVQNEYQPVECPHCGEIQYQRLTHIWHYDQSGNCTPEYHINRGDLESLKTLLITYIPPDTTPVREIEENGTWYLVAGEDRIARGVQ